MTACSKPMTDFGTQFTKSHFVFTTHCTSRAKLCLPVDLFFIIAWVV